MSRLPSDYGLGASWRVCLGRARPRYSKPRRAGSAIVFEYGSTGGWEGVDAHGSSPWAEGPQDAPGQGVLGCVERVTNNPFRSTGQPCATSAFSGAVPIVQKTETLDGAALLVGCRISDHLRGVRKTLISAYVGGCGDPVAVIDKEFRT
jgi:hypothetical protein